VNWFLLLCVPPGRLITSSKAWDIKVYVLLQLHDRRYGGFGGRLNGLGGAYARAEGQPALLASRTSQIRFSSLSIFLIIRSMRGPRSATVS
jgi:hypothetical protein